MNSWARRRESVTGARAGRREGGDGNRENGLSRSPLSLASGSCAPSRKCGVPPCGETAAPSQPISYASVLTSLSVFRNRVSTCGSSARPRLRSRRPARPCAASSCAHRPAAGGTARATRATPLARCFRRSEKSEVPLRRRAWPAHHGAEGKGRKGM